MNTTKIGFRLLSAVLVFAMAAFVASCSEDAGQVGFTESQSVTSEAAADSYFEDAENLSSAAANADDADLGGRAAGSIKDRDPRFACATITLEKLANNTGGTITIDFGDGCEDAKGNVRKGKIIIDFVGERRSSDAEVVTTFDGFFVNGIKIEGTRTVSVYDITNTYITHEISLEGGKLTWPDNSTATRSAHHYRRWLHNATPLNLTDDQVILLSGASTPGTASGVNRNGQEYSMQIMEDLVFKFECLLEKKYIPVSGQKVLEVNGNTITVDYGDGSCDNEVTVTLNGESKQVTIVRG